jgi:hypothetical protein
MAKIHCKEAVRGRFNTHGEPVVELDGNITVTLTVQVKPGTTPAEFAHRLKTALECEIDAALLCDLRASMEARNGR